MSEKLLLKQAIFCGSWLVFPFALWLVHRLFRTGNRIVASLALLACAGFVEARFVEPQLIIVRETTVRAGVDLKVALIADVHVGLYKSRGFLERVVAELNTLDVDMVLIAGDWTYEPQEPLADLLAPLARLRHRAYSVPGNHDSEAPGPPLQAELSAALVKHGIVPIENRTLEFPGFTLAGLGDRWGGNDELRTIGGTRANVLLLVLMHNPDSTLDFPPGKVALAFAGHTHGGQIRIPWLYRRVIPTKGPFDRGLHELPDMRVFVTSGLGEIGLPLRFLNPPVIDVVRLTR